MSELSKDWYLCTSGWKPQPGQFLRSLHRQYKELKSFTLENVNPISIDGREGWERFPNACKDASFTSRRISLNNLVRTTTEFVSNDIYTFVNLILNSWLHLNARKLWVLCCLDSSRDMLSSRMTSVSFSSTSYEMVPPASKAKAVGRGYAQS